MPQLPIPVGFATKFGALFAALAALAAIVSQVLDGDQSITVASILAAVLAVVRVVDGRMKQATAQQLASSGANVQAKV